MNLIKTSILVLGLLSLSYEAKAKFEACPEPEEIDSELKQIKGTDKWKLKKSINGFEHTAPIIYNGKGKPTLSPAYKTHVSSGRSGSITLWCEYNFTDESEVFVLYNHIPLLENKCCEKAKHRLGFECHPCEKQKSVSPQDNN